MVNRQWTRERLFELLELFEAGEDDVFTCFFDFAGKEDFVEDSVDLWQ